MIVKEFQIDSKEASRSLKRVINVIKENEANLKMLSNVIKKVTAEKGKEMNEVSLGEMLNELKAMESKEKAMKKGKKGKKIKNWEKKRFYQK